MAMQNAIKHIQEIIQNTITLFKTEKILTNVNWTLVEEKTKIEYIIPVSWYLAKKIPPFPPWVCLSCFSLYKNLDSDNSMSENLGGGGIFATFAILVQWLLWILSLKRWS